jgi:hypothetical protein
MNHLAKSELTHGQYYRGRCRNTSVARWCASTKSGHPVFLYVRRKFGDAFVEEIQHPEDDRGFDLFYPFEVTEPTEDQRVSDETLEAW